MNSAEHYALAEKRAGELDKLIDQAQGLRLSSASIAGYDFITRATADSANLHLAFADVADEPR